MVYWVWHHFILFCTSWSAYSNSELTIHLKSSNRISAVQRTRLLTAVPLTLELPWSSGCPRKDMSWQVEYGSLSYQALSLCTISIFVEQEVRLNKVSKWAHHSDAPNIPISGELELSTCGRLPIKLYFRYGHQMHFLTKGSCPRSRTTIKSSALSKATRSKYTT